MQVRAVRKKSLKILYLSAFIIAFFLAYEAGSYSDEVNITFSAKSAESGWVIEKSSKTDPSSAFSSESSLLNALKIKIDTELSGGIQYTFHETNGDWLKWSKDGQVQDCSSDKSFNAIKVNLYGDVSKKYNILYRIKTKDNDWSAWTRNGEIAGSINSTNPITGLQVAVESNSAIEKLKQIVNKSTSSSTASPDAYTTVSDLKPITTTVPSDITGLQKLEEPLKGIDVSYYNDKIDWAKVKAAGINYAIIQVGYRGCTFGTLKSDKKFEYNIKSAIENDIKVGIYYVTQAINVKEAEEEADYVLKRIGDYSIDYPIYIDIEEVKNSRQKKLNNKQRTDICKAFCDKIYEAGYETGIYSCQYYFESLLNTKELSKYNIWVAAYGIKSKPTTSFEYQMWQCSETGSVNGIKGDVDINYVYYDYLNYTRTEPSAEQTAPAITTTAAPSTSDTTASPAPTSTASPSPENAVG